MEGVTILKKFFKIEMGSGEKREREQIKGREGGANRGWRWRKKI
jgi:hypothetical protein